MSIQLFAQAIGLLYYCQSYRQQRRQHPEAFDNSLAAHMAEQVECELTQLLESINITDAFGGSYQVQI